MSPTAKQRRANTNRARARRILQGELDHVKVPAELLGILWRDGGTTTRAIMSTRFDPLILDACHARATNGIQQPVGRGHHIDYGQRDGGDRRDWRNRVDPNLVAAVVAGHTPPRRLRPRERRLAAQRMHEQHIPPQVIADRLGVSTSHVYQLRKRETVVL